MEEFKYNINDEDTKAVVQNAMKSKQGQIMYEFIFQVLEDEFDEDKIDLSADNQSVGEQFKVIKKIKYSKQKIDSIINNNYS